MKTMKTWLIALIVSIVVEAILFTVFVTGSFGTMIVAGAGMIVYAAILTLVTHKEHFA